MLDQIRKHLQKWLSDPSPGADLQALRDRMDSLEQLVMISRQPPDHETTLAPVVESHDLATQPDVHLGAQ